MTRPRQVLPGQYLLITRKCTQSQFLLRPDNDTNNNVLYCLGCAMQRYGMEVLMMTFESNHEHIVIYDRDGIYPEFAEYFHKLLARSQNALRGRWENFWSSEELSALRLITREDVIARLVYTAANPVKDRLVDRVHHWPGINGYTALLQDRTLTAKRPRFFFRRNGPMPASVTFRMTIPAELGDRDDVIAQLRAGVDAIEGEVAAEIRKGARVVGCRRIRAQSWRDTPTTVTPHRTLRPRIAARDPARRVQALLEYREFLCAYRAAREEWQAHRAAVFPVGTYWLRRFADVTIADAVS